LCSLSEKVENGLSKGEHQFLPAVAKGEEDLFAPKCNKIKGDTYEFKRSLNLPGRKELEAKVKQKIQGVDAEIRKRLNKGVGIFCCHFTEWLKTSPHGKKSCRFCRYSESS
jgi:hypothetical protein